MMPPKNKNTRGRFIIFFVPSGLSQQVADGKLAQEMFRHLGQIQSRNIVVARDHTHSPCTAGVASPQQVHDIMYSQPHTRVGSRHENRSVIFRNNVWWSERNARWNSPFSRLSSLYSDTTPGSQLVAGFMLFEIMVILRCTHPVHKK